MRGARPASPALRGAAGLSLSLRSSVRPAKFFGRPNQTRSGLARCGRWLGTLVFSGSCTGTQNSEQIL